MNANMYKNIIYSIRNFLREIDSSIMWYFDEHNQTMDEDTFIEVFTSYNRTEHLRKWYYYDFVNLNLFAKTDVEEEVATIIEGLEGRKISIYDYLDTQDRIDYVQIDRVETNWVGKVGKYQVKNVTIYYRILG